MLFLAPAKGLNLPSTPDWMREDAPTYEARLKEMAFVIERVVLDEAETPIASVAHPRAFTAVALAVIGAGETRFAKDTYHGHNGQPECYRGPGQEARCDHGRSAGIFQVMVGAGKTAEGWTKADLFGDFEKETRVALHRIRQSVAAAQRCQLPASGWLNVYGSGSCKIGGTEAAARVHRIFKLFGQGKFKDGYPVVSTPTPHRRHRDRPDPAAAVRRARPIRPWLGPGRGALRRPLPSRRLRHRVGLPAVSQIP